MSTGLSPLRDRDHPSACRLDVRRTCLSSWILGLPVGLLSVSLLAAWSICWCVAQLVAQRDCQFSGCPPLPAPLSLTLGLSLSVCVSHILSSSICRSPCFGVCFPPLHSPSHSGPKTQQLPAAPPLLLHPGTPHPTPVSALASSWSPPRARPAEL